MKGALQTVLCSIFPALVCCATAQTGSGSWPFAYPGDKGAGCLLDLRSLNEKTAGETGYVRVGSDGRSFVRGDGKPIRFWPVCGYGYRLKPEEMAENARFFAKMGVNMVRIHGSISPKGKGKTLQDYDADEIDRIQRYVAALKKEGIYVTISPYWANGGHAGAAASWGLGYGDGEDIWGLLFFDDRLREGYKGWLRKLYLSPNPYTGVPIANDPAVAIVQVQNEDSLLFWTFQAIKPAQKKALAKKFAAWLERRYGSFDAVKQRWTGAEQGGDDWSTGTPALLETWVLTQTLTGGMKARADDETAFLIDQQKGFYADITSFLHKDIGYKGLVNACNWITADPVKLNDAERYTYTATDVEAVNRYYGGVHQGPNSGWRVDEGDFFTEPSGLLAPRTLPFNIKQTVGHPTIITESGWVHPLGYQAEGPLLCAAYESLTGIQGLYWFELGAKDFAPDPTFGFVTTTDGSHPLSKWEDAVPQMLGQFPAAALLYRKGYVKQGAVVVHEERTRASLDSREIPIIAEDPSFDPNHNGSDARAGSNQAIGVDPLAFLVGPVEVKYDGDPSKTSAKNLSQYLDGSARSIASITGELQLDYGKGLFRLDAPKAQAIAGFFAKGGGTFKTSSLTVTSDSEYGSVTVVSLDDKPIATSKRLLVQIGSVVRPTGWQQAPATQLNQDKKTTIQGWKVVNSGKMPWQVRKVHGSLAIANGGLTKATALDPGGYSMGMLQTTSSGGFFKLDLPAVEYVILE